MNRSGTLPWPGWEIVRRLGSGSYGSVFEIEREQFGIHERAALKVISFPKDPGELEEWRQSGYDDQTLAQSYRRQMERVLNEYKLLMEFKGTSHIVNCDTYEVIAHPDGIGWDIYIRMELLTPLKKYLAREITPEQTVKLGMDLCKALSLCREKDIIHRDIKPDNILVSDSGDFKLGDFGVAKTAERTMAGTRTGTPNFTAPEVYHNEPYGKSVDIYSLGMVLYWMLNRRALPFLPLPPQMPSPDEMQEALLRRMRGEALPRPVDGSRALQDVVLKACAYRPEDRYATPEELRRALKAVYAADTSAADTIPDAQPSEEPSFPDADATMGNNWETGPQTETQPECMISCPACHKLVPSDSQFCFYCGGNLAQKKESKSEDFADTFSSLFGSASPGGAFTLCPNCRTPVPSGSQFCQNCGKPIGSAGQNMASQQNAPKKTTVYMGDNMKKWDTLAGESEVLSWKETSLSLPEKLPFAHIKVTTQRILISSESRMARGVRNSSLLAYAATSANEHGKPWAMIPLECVRSFRQSGKTEITIDADKTFKFVVMGSSLTFGKAKTYTSEIYEALRKVMPDKAL